MLKKACTLLGTLGILGILPGVLFAADSPQIVPLVPAAGGSQSIPNGISLTGVVGSTLYFDDQGLGYGIPTLWVGQQPTLLPVPTGSQGIATSINDSGVAIGVVRSMDSADPRPALWQNGQLALLDTNGLPAGIPNSINSGGIVVGQIYDVNGPSNAAIWTNGQLAILDGFSAAFAINNSGQIVVAAPTGESVWKDGAISSISPLGDPRTLAAHDINNLGHVVGGTTITGSTAPSYGFIWKDGATTALPLLAQDSYAYALAINDSDLIVGDAYNENQGIHAVLWKDGQAYDLNGLIPNDSGWRLYEANGVLDDGTIVGYGSFNGQIRAFELAPTSSPASLPVPEPGTAVSLVLAAPLLMLRRRRGV